MNAFEDGRPMSTSDIIDLSSMLGQMASGRYVRMRGSVKLRRSRRIRRGDNESAHRGSVHQTVDHVFKFLQAASSRIIGGGARFRRLLSNDIAVLATGGVTSFDTGTACLLYTSDAADEL